MTAEGDIHVTSNQTINYNQIVEEAKRAGSLLNLPQTNVTFFAGRDDDLQKVHELLRKNQRVAVSAFVKGMGGVGKSELALQYALRHLLTDYGGGICWLRGNEGTLPTQLQDFVQVQLGETMPDGLDSGEKLAGYCWRRLSERLGGRMLVVLDDVKDYGNVEPFLPTLDGKFRVLVTTRLGLGNAMQQYTLDVLVLKAAVDLLKSFLPEADPRRDNEEAIKNLCTWLGRLPLAIELVGRYLARKPDLSIAKMQERLEAKKLQQEALTDTQKRALAEMTAKLNVAAAFDLSWQELSEGAQRLACLLSLFALAPIHWQWVMDSMGDVDEEDLEAFRDDELLNLHLLERTQQGVYELHQLLREYFQFQLQRHPEWQVLRQQVAVLLLNISKGIEQTITLDFVKEVAPAIPHLEILGREILDVIPNSEDNLVWAFLGISIFYRSQGQSGLAIPFMQNCLNVTKSHFGVEHPKVAESLQELGLLHFNQGNLKEAENLYNQALSIFKRKLEPTHLLIAEVSNNLANLYQSQERYIEAKALYLQLLPIFEKQLGLKHTDLAIVFNNFASLYRKQKEYDQAIPLYSRSYSIWRQQLGVDHPILAVSLNEQGLLYHALGEYSEAEKLYQEALSIRRKGLVANHPNVAESLNNLAKLYKDQRKYNEAKLLFLEALEIDKYSLGEYHYEVGMDLSYVAEIYCLLKCYKQSELSFKQALSILGKSLGLENSCTIEISEKYALLLNVMLIEST